MRQILYPVEIPERCDLQQALRWVAYREYPTTDIFEGTYLRISTGPRNLFGRKVPNLDEQLIFETPDQKPVTREMHLESVGIWEKAKARFISLLNTGKIKSTGRLSETHNDVAGYRSASDWQFWPWDRSHAEPTEIPPEDWTAIGTNFDFSTLKTPKREYQDITINSDDLFSAHPEERPIDFPAEMRGQTVVSKHDKPAPKSNRAGRPSLIKAEHFAEILRLQENGSKLLKKQSLLVRHLKKFSENWPQPPTERTIEQFVKGIFDARGQIKKGGNSSPK